MDHNFTDRDLFTDNHSLTPDLGWMMQSHQVDNDTLLQALVHEEYVDIYRFTAYLMDDATLGVDATQQALASGILDRYRYWGEIPLKAWLLKGAHRACQKMLGKDQLVRGGLHSGVDLDLAEELRFLDQNQSLILFLRFGLGLDLAQVAYVLERKPQAISTLLRRLRREIEDRLEYPDEISSRDFSLGCQPAYYQQIQSFFDGQLDTQEQYDLKNHLAECHDCRAAVDRLLRVETRLKRFFGAQWPAPDLSEGSLQTLAAEISGKLEQKGKRSNLSLPSKEVGIVLFVVAVMVILGWATRAITGDTPGDSANLDPQVTQLMNGSGSLTPLPNTGRQFGYQAGKKSNNPLAWYRPPAGVPNDYSLDFSNVIEKTKISSSADMLSNSAIASLSTVLHFWGWEGDPATLLQLNPQDPAGLFSTLQTFVDQQPGMTAVLRSGGTVDALASFISAGFPVIIEVGIYNNQTYTWSSHFEIVSSYNYAARTVSVLSSYQELGEYASNSFWKLHQDWMPFRNQYLVIYPKNGESIIRHILETQQDIGSSPTS